LLDFPLDPFFRIWVATGGILKYFEDSAKGCAWRLENRHSVPQPNAQRRYWTKRQFRKGP